MPIFNRITYSPVETKVTKYSHTPNVKDDGTQDGNYTNNMSTNDVVTIPGASKLHVKITYGGESASYDWVSVWQGAHSDYKAESDWSKAIPDAQKLGGGSHTSSSNTKEFDVEGDSVTFGFKSDSSVVGDGYGYYAVITADVTPDVTPDVTSEAYAVFNSSDGNFTFFRDDKGKYTDGQVSGTKTYYTGFEDIAWETDPSWYNSSSDNQKNTIKTVTFKDKIKPKTCYDWFSNASSLASITGLDKLDTSAVTNMKFMFYNCSDLTSLDVSSFNTASVKDMRSMFYNCSDLTSLDVSSFNTASVKDMRSMFYNCSDLTSLDVSSFNTASVKDMRFMFRDCSSLTSLNLSSFNTEKVTNMSGMFNSCSDLTSLDVSSFNTLAVESMYDMFRDCSSLTSLNLSSFNTAKVTDMSGMFNGCSSLTSLNLSSFNTAKVTDMNGMFNGCSSLTSLNLSSFNTAKVTDMNGMFNGCSSLTSLDLSSFNTENVTLTGWMFDSCSQLKTIYASSLFTTNAVSSSSSMFYSCTSLVGGAGTKYDKSHTDKTYARIDGGTSRPGYFTTKVAPAKAGLQE